MPSKMRSSVMLFPVKFHSTSSERPVSVPTISITHNHHHHSSRRVSVSTPIRFTRTFSDDSLESIERVGRRELKLRMDEERANYDAIRLLPSTCSSSSVPPPPHLAEMGRSRTTETAPTFLPPEIVPPGLSPSSNSRQYPFPPSDFPMSLKRSAGDVSSSSPPSPSKKTLAEYTGLSIYQQKLLLQCWPNIFSTGANGQFAIAIFNNLTSKNAKAKQLLTKANSVAVFNNEMDSTAMHSKLVVELIDNILRNLDAEHTPITQQISEIGRMHRGLKQEGLGIQMWDEFGDAVIESLRRFDAVRKHKELRRAWLSIIVYITDNLKQGQSISRFPSNYDLNQPGEQQQQQHQLQHQRSYSPFGRRSNVSEV